MHISCPLLQTKDAEAGTFLQGGNVPAHISKALMVIRDSGSLVLGG